MKNKKILISSIIVCMLLVIGIGFNFLFSSANKDRVTQTNSGLEKIEQDKLNEEKEVNNTSVIKRAFNVGKEFMNLGMYMAEGRNFKTNSQYNMQRRTYNRSNINNTRQEDKNEENNKIITVEADDANE